MISHDILQLIRKFSLRGRGMREALLPVSWLMVAVLRPTVSLRRR